VGVHHVQLAMPPGEEETASRFYAGTLGMERVPKPDALASRGGCWFRGAGLELHLGADVTEDTQLEGHDRCYVRDPFGNRLELIEETA
jgi:catechol 2,3-dioxygenase-like lactoylglutathione lyase family enzyme